MIGIDQMSRTISITSRRLTDSQRPYTIKEGMAMEKGTKHHYYGDIYAVTTFINALSLLFPEGEAFFVRAVKAFASDPRVLANPKLVEDIDSFVAQEVQHSAEHYHFNAAVCKKYGHNMTAATRWVKWSLQIGNHFGLFDSRYSDLAVTCSLEHLTAVFAEVLLTTRNGEEFLHTLSPSHRSLWIWHAIEETEHKAVAFDVYQTVGGSAFFRIYRHFVTLYIFFNVIMAMYLYFMYESGRLFDFTGHWQLFKFLFVSPAILRLSLPLQLEYCAPSYHPWGKSDGGAAAVSVSGGGAYHRAGTSSDAAVLKAVAKWQAYLTLYSADTDIGMESDIDIESHCHGPKTPISNKKAATSTRSTTTRSKSPASGSKLRRRSNTPTPSKGTARAGARSPSPSPSRRTVSPAKLKLKRPKSPTPAKRYAYNMKTPKGK